MEEKQIGLNAEKFEFLLLALHEVITPLIGKEKFRVVVEKDPELPDIRITYQFKEDMEQDELLKRLDAIEDAIERLPKELAKLLLDTLIKDYLKEANKIEAYELWKLRFSNP